MWTICFAFTELVAINVGLVHQGFMHGDLKKVTNEASVLFLHIEINPNSTITEIVLEDVGSQNWLLKTFFTGVHAMCILPHYACMTSLDKSILILAFLGRHLVLDFLQFFKNHDSNMEEVITL